MAKRKRSSLTPFEATDEAEATDTVQATETVETEEENAATGPNSKDMKDSKGSRGSMRTQGAKPEPVGRTRAQQRREEAKRSKKGPNPSLWYIIGGIGLAVAVVAAIVGISLAEGKQSNVQQNQPIEAQGTALVPMPDSGPDPAVGVTAPKLKGKTFNGEEVDISYPSVVVIVAHWCPHCQKEVPLFLPIVKDLKGQVKVHLISSAVQPGRAHYPPSEWLKEVEWPKPVADDTADTSSKAFGGGGFPTFVAVGADGKVRARYSGEIGVDRFKQMIELAGMTQEEAKAAEANRSTSTTPASVTAPGNATVSGQPALSGQPIPAPAGKSTPATAVNP